MRCLRVLLISAVLLASVAAKQDAVVTIANPTDHACYRRTHHAKDDKCAQGFELGKASTCWAECPLEYPVECGMECILQNKDCAKEVLTKVAVVAEAALKTASLGVASFGVAAKGIDVGIRCGKQLFGVLDKAMAYSDELETKFPEKTKDQVLSLAMQSDIAIVDLPLAIMTCFKIPVPKNLDKIAPEVASAAKIALQQIINFTGGNKGDKQSMSPAMFANVSSAMFAGTQAANVLPTAPKELQTMLDSGTACGRQLKDAMDQVTALAQETKRKDASASATSLRITLNASPLVVQTLPAAIQQCGGSLQDTRKLIDSVLHSVTDAAEQNGKPVDKTTYALSIADMALDVISTFDPTGIAAMVKEFVQPICDPTILYGEIDDGAANTSLALRTMGDAFVGSSGFWKNSGDGQVVVNFQSHDKKDVKVNIKAGGDVIDKVKVKAGKTATWSHSLADMQGKTLYMDRWRPGILGLPGTGGGSLLLWVPMPTQKGHLDLSVQLQVS